MGKLRDWMHGRGRGVVIAVVILLALWIIVDFYRTNHPKPEQKEPAEISEPYEGSDSSPAEDLQEDSDSAEDPEETQDKKEDDSKKPGDSSDGQTVTEEKAGRASDEDTSKEDPELDTTEEDTKDSGLTTTEEDAGTPGEASRTDTGDITLGFAGDINLDETWTVMKHMRRKGKGIQGCIDPRLIRKMRSYDYMVLNNEFSISNRGKAMKGKAYTFRAPRRNVKLLQQLGVDAVSLANNHVYDYGKQAFLDTLSTLENNGIKYTGGGKDSKEAKKPVYFESKGKTIAVIAATRAEKYILTPAAGKHSPGVFRTYDDTQYVRAIRRARKKADVVIAFVHWGTEYSTKLETAQTSQAKDYINAGADVVVGAHTHCLQGVGYYKGKPIFYSLGNYWFNEKTLYTTLLELTIRENGTIEARMLPCLQSGRETHLLTAKSKVRKFVNYVNGISENAKIGAKGVVHSR